MKDFYLKEFSLLKLGKISIEYVKKEKKFLAITFAIYLVSVCFLMSNLVDYLIRVTHLLMIENQEMVNSILYNNPSGSGYFVLIKFIQMIIIESLPYLLLVITMVSLLRIIFNVSLFVRQDLYVKGISVSKEKFIRLVMHKILPAVKLDFLFSFMVFTGWFLYFMILLADNFVFDSVNLYLTVGFLCFVGTVCLMISPFTYQAAIKYGMPSVNAMGHSYSLFKTNKVNTTIISLALPTFIMLIMIWFLYFGTLESTYSSYYTLSIILVILWIIYFNIFKVYKNFMFINLDYLYTQTLEEDDIYIDRIDLIVKDLKIDNKDLIADFKVMIPTIKKKALQLPAIIPTINKEENKDKKVFKLEVNRIFKQFKKK